LAGLRLSELGVTVSAVRRRNIRVVEPSDDLYFQAGDVVVLFGRPEGLSVAEERLLKGG
jgi:CPA2 family monovalent cation:H+ antiporter-2